MSETNNASTTAEPQVAGVISPGDKSDSVGSDERIKALEEEASKTSLKLESITDGQNERGIPAAKFIEDIETFANSFTPPASAELLIGAYSDLFAKYKRYEDSLNGKSESSES